VLEYKIDFGPGYRVYFGKDGDRLVILVGGGTKKRQDKDIAAAQLAWKDYNAASGREMTGTDQDFRDTIRERAQRPTFRQNCCAEGPRALLCRGFPDRAQDPAVTTFM